jgi:hypothetical protein
MRCETLSSISYKHAGFEHLTQPYAGLLLPPPLLLVLLFLHATLCLQLEAAQASLQECVTTFDGRLQQLQEQVAQQETTEGTHGCMTGCTCELCTIPALR